MPFDLNKLLRKSKVQRVSVLKTEPKKEPEEEPFQIYIPTYEPESDDELVSKIPKRTKLERKVPLNPLSDE